MEFVDIAMRLVYPYSLWIGECAREERIDKLLFLSRDGSLPFIMYDSLAQKKIVPDVKRHYLYVSRHSLQVAAGELSFNNHENVVEQSKAYLKSKISTSSRIGVVDVGWNGSAVRLLSSMFPTVEFFSLYFGSHHSLNSPLKSFVGNIGLSRYFGFTELVETLISSPDPSVKLVYKKNNKIIRDFYKQNKSVRVFQEELHANFKKMMEAPDFKGPKILDSKSVYKFLVKLTFFPNTNNVEMLMNYEHSHSGDHDGGSRLIWLENRISSKRIYLPFWSLKAVVNSNIKFSEKISKVAFLVLNLFIMFIKKMAGNRISKFFYLGRLRR